MYARSLTAAALAATMLFSAGALAASAKDWTGCRGKDAETAIAACTRVLNDKRLSPRERADALHNRGLGWKAKGELDRAIADYTKAIEADPKWAVPYAKRGDAHDDNGNREKAVSDLSEAIRLDPDYEWAYAIRGYIYDGVGEYDRAIADYTQSIRLDPKDAGTVANRGWSKRKKGDLDGAFADFNEAIRLDPKLVRAHYVRGLAWSDRGDYDRAITDFNEAIRLDPKGDTAYHDRGLAHFYKGDFAASADDLRKSNDIKPESFTVLRLFIARSRSGVSAGASAEFDRAAAELKSKDWPRPIIQFYLGERSAESMVAAADTAERRCDAQFYLAEWHLVQNRRTEAADALRLALAEGCPKYLFEYMAAQVDLKRVGQ
jgi:lipoprotein NlpI